MIQSLPTVFEQPNDPNQKIWRYFDMAKFFDLLNSNSIFFARSDKLGDRFEGSLSFPTLEDAESWIKTLTERTDDLNPLPRYELETAKNTRTWLLKYLIPNVGITCWHLSSHESAAMWNLYSKSNEGIAVQSTYSKLYNILDKANLHGFMGHVKYIDYKKENMGPNILSPFIHKRESYEHEKEIRAMFSFLGGVNNHLSLEDGGCKIKVDLSELIDNIIIAHDTAQWQISLIQDLVTKYLPHITVKPSELKGDPLY